MYFIRIFSKNTIFFSTLLVIFLFIYQKPVWGNQKGSPYIQQILLDNYGFSNNNFSIIQDQYGILYISNSNGILQYDGSYWELIELPGIAKLTLSKENIIYVGTYNDFGFLQPDRNNQLKFISLIDTSKVSQNSIGQIEKVISHKDHIYFNTKNTLYQWDGENINILDTSSVRLDIFYVENQLFLKKSGLGLQKFINNKFRTVPNYSFFNDKIIYDILPYNQQLLVKTNTGFYLFDNFIVAAFQTVVNDLIDANFFSSACLLDDGSYAFGTRLNGIFIMDKTGNLVEHINESSGLFGISVNELFADKANNLWALHDQGISRIEYPSGYSYFTKKNGLQGNVKSVIRFKNTLYVATSLGVFYLSKGKDTGQCIDCAVFKPVQGIKSDCFQFHKINGQLFITTAKGIYEIKDKRSILFYNREADDITAVLHSKNHPSYIFIGHNNGISALKYEQGILIIRNKLEGINDKINSIAEEKNGTLWFASTHSGVYKINPFKDYSPRLPYTHFSKEQMFAKDINWINLYSAHDGMLFSTSEGLLRYDNNRNIFYKDTIIGINFTKENQWVYPIVEDNHKNLWLNIIGKGYARNKTLVKWFNNDSLKTLKPLPLNRIKDFFVTSIHPDDSGIVWFGGYEGLVRLDLNYKLEKPKTFNTYLHKIITGSDSVLYQLPYSSKSLADNLASGDLDIREFNYHFNRFYFEFTANDYASEDQLQFQHKLEGFDTTWSKWSTVNFKEYTNLFEGKYTFKVRAKNIFDETANETHYRFIIRPPLYRTTMAYFIYLVAIVFLIVLIIKWRSYYYAKERFKLENIINERTEEIVIQKEKADNLLERVLPKTTATELKSGRKAGPYHYNMVTVLFSDIQGFTKISEQMDSEHLIDELDKFFLQFDTVVEKYNIEKIKTIGDAYMCAGGIPEKNRTNPVEVVLAALEMQQYMKSLKMKTNEGNRQIWDLRIGIDTGPVVAGVLGRKKITYDIWGGTVNTASRMEASGEPGKINIAENTYMLIKDFFICQYRGKMPVKYKGEIDMYFVEGFKPHFATDLKGLYPNEKLFIQLQLLRVNDVEEFVLSKLEEGLPDNLYYHNVKHTIDVVTQVELIGRSEGVSEEDMLILKTAALFHDMGHLVNYDTHEEEGVRLAKKLLPNFQYNERQIEKICRLIMVTQMPPQPKDLLEEIMCDADLDYLGRTDFVPVSISLYKELHERNKIDSILEWNKMQTQFIKKHQYFTKTAQKLREVNKNKQLENIQNEIRREMEEGDE